MKLKTRIALLAAMGVFAIAMAFYRLENWMPHQENPMMILLMYAFLFASIVLGVIQIVQGIREKRWLWIALGVLAAGLCFWGARLYLSIPFCLECNGGVTAEQLGWMAPWFFGQ